MADFAKIVEIFDAKGVSFVSVTQQFNTTTSMGRLTLNVLLSFAQFEREVIGERIRDKIAASKKKGMWMGGVPPLGYAVRDRTADHRRARGRDRGVTSSAAMPCSARSIVCSRNSKPRASRQDAGPSVSGRSWGGQPIGRGGLYPILQNRIYRGEIVHQDQTYPSEHAAIIDPAMWDAVQARLTDNAVERDAGIRVKNPSLLAGLLFDSEGQRMTSTHAVQPCLDVLARRADVVARRQQLDKDRPAVRTGALPKAGVDQRCDVAARHGTSSSGWATGCEQCTDPMAASSGRRLDLHQRGAALSGSNIVYDDADGSRRPLMAAKDHVRWFEDIRLKDVPAVGGKTASLGELRALLGDRVPDGFALTAQAYRDALAEAGVEAELRRLLSDFDHHDVALLAERAAAARRLVYEATGNAASSRRDRRRLSHSRREMRRRRRGRGAQLGDRRRSADRQLRRAA